MRILLVHPECRTGEAGFRVAAMPEPLGLEILAGSVPDSEVQILDMRVDPDLEGAIERFSPRVVGVTALTTEVYAAQEVLACAKAHSQDIVTVAGGHHATLLPEDFMLPYLDAICLGEGEKVFPALISRLAKSRKLDGLPNLIWQDAAGQFVSNGRLLRKTDADRIPAPRRDLVERYRSEYFWTFHQADSTVCTGRGCPYRCRFCSVWQFYQGLTCQMSPERVMEEIRAVPTRHTTFVDDNFLMNYRRELEIARRIRAEGWDRLFAMECRTDSIVRHPDLVEKWVEIGLFGVLLGLEGASDAMLQDVNKRNSAKVNGEAIRILKSNGVTIWGAFIVHPEWTADDFRRLKDYVAEQELVLGQYTVLTPLPGTQLYREEYDRLLTHDYRCYDTLHSVLPTRLPREEFYRQLAYLYTQPKLGPIFDMVASGKYEVADLRRAYGMLKKMSSWESYLENDPILGNRQWPDRAMAGRVAGRRASA